MTTNDMFFTTTDTGYHKMTYLPKSDIITMEPSFCFTDEIHISFWANKVKIIGLWFIFKSAFPFLFNQGMDIGWNYYQYHIKKKGLYFYIRSALPFLWLCKPAKYAMSISDDDYIYINFRF